MLANQVDPARCSRESDLALLMAESARETLAKLVEPLLLARNQVCCVDLLETVKQRDHVRRRRHRCEKAFVPDSQDSETPSTSDTSPPPHRMADGERARMKVLMLPGYTQNGTIFVSLQRRAHDAAGKVLS